MDLLTDLQVSLLRKFWPLDPFDDSGNEAALLARLPSQLGSEVLQEIRGKTVIDFGCGRGLQAVELALLGAGHVIGLDIREDELVYGRRRALEAGVSDRCHFVTSTDQRADIIISIDAFEHFDNPAEILRIMDSLLKPDGKVVISFGPTWYHPIGGHLFSVFPWAHLVFSEKALIAWRSTIKNDGATCFHEVAGGLNQMTIRGFENLVKESPFRFARLETVPIRRMAILHNRVTREFTTAAVRCRLVKHSPADPRIP